jgi:DNA-directed RNA polymerase subunit RPC12/RpoP
MVVAERPETSSFACGRCGAALRFDGLRAQTCPYCASPTIVERPESQDQPAPRFVVTFAGDRAAARRSLERWLGRRRIFADSAFARARVEDLRGVYLPAYLYSAVGTTEYSAQIGENYTETEDYTTTDERGRSVTKQRTVTRTEYRPLSGRHVGYLADVVVSASAGLDNAELAAIEPFDLKQLRRYTPALISGWIAEESSRDADACMQASRHEAGDLLGDQLRRFMPGDSYSDLSYHSTVSWESLDPILVPVWVLAVRYRDDKPPIRVVINGQTGAVAGRVPLSIGKLVAALTVLLAIAAAIWWWLA